MTDKEEIENNAIETDGTEDSEEIEETVGVSQEISVHRLDPDIQTYYQKGKVGDLIVNPEFRRKFVWDIKRASQLIESILLRVPIPTIYVSEVEDGRLEVIDEQQRLSSIFNFMDGKFPQVDRKSKEHKIIDFKLKGLKSLKDLQGKMYINLDKTAQKKIMDYPLNVVVIEKGSNPDIKFEMFERINRGSMPLNDQELRNCLYRGKLNRALNHKFCTNRDFLQLLNLKAPDTRFRDVELILRFLYFCDKTYLNYKPPIKLRINEFMKEYQNPDERKSDEFLEKFKTSVELTKETFGMNAFRRFYRGNDEKPAGYWEKKLNVSLFEIVMWGFSRYTKHNVMPVKDNIREALLYLLTTDEEFIRAIEISTTSKEAVNIRFEKWKDALNQIVGVPKASVRCFSGILKKDLLDKQKGICPFCNTSILNIDDAHIDHVKPYWIGGETIPENAQLLHRFCNLKKGGKIRNQ